MTSDVKTETFELFDAFFKDKKAINFFSSHKNAEKVRFARSFDEDYKGLGAMLLADFESTEFGQKCVQMMVKYNCSFNFNPEAQHYVDKQKVPKKQNTKGEFVYGGPDGKYALNIYENSPDLARSCIDHEAVHFVQRVKAENAYGKMGLNGLEFDKYLMVNLAFEADAFARQVEEAYFNKERPELFKSSKTFCGPIAEDYEKEFLKTGDKNKAYSKAFSSFFTSQKKEVFYSKYYAEQYFAANTHSRSDKRDINIAKFIQVITEKRFDNPDGFEKLVTDNFRFKSSNWKVLNREYSKMSKHLKEDGKKEDLSYMKFSTSDNSSTDDFNTVREFMDKLKLTNKDKGDTEIDIMLKSSRRRLRKTMQLYEDNKIEFTKEGSFASALNDWIKSETLAMREKPDYTTERIITEVSRIYETLDSRKKKQDKHTMLAIKEKEKTFNQQNPVKGQLPLGYVQSAFKGSSM